MKKIVSFAVLALLGLVKVTQANPEVVQTVEKAVLASPAIVESHKPVITKAEQLPTKDFSAEPVLKTPNSVQVTSVHKKSHKKAAPVVKGSDHESCTEDIDCEKNEYCKKNREESDDGKCYKKVAVESSTRGRTKVKGKELCYIDRDCSPHHMCQYADEDDTEGVCVRKSSTGKVKKSSHKLAQVDCVTKGDPCEGQTCELHQLCIADSEDEGYCFPKECANDDDWDIKRVKSGRRQKPQLKRNKKPTVAAVDCTTKGEACEGDVCEVGQSCLLNSEDDGYCYPQECAYEDDYYLRQFKVKKPAKKPSKKAHEHKSNKKSSIDCNTRGDKCFMQNCEVGHVCLPVSEDEGYGYCFPVGCKDYRDDEYDWDLVALKKVKKSAPTKKHHHHEKKVKLDCNPTALCEEPGDCDVGEVCAQDDHSNAYCLREECVNEGMKVLSRGGSKRDKKTYFKVFCGGQEDCNENEDCNCRFWPECLCVPRKKAVLTNFTAPTVHKKHGLKDKEFIDPAVSSIQDDIFIQQ